MDEVLKHDRRRFLAAAVLTAVVPLGVTGGGARWVTGADAFAFTFG